MKLEAQRRAHGWSKKVFRILRKFARGTRVATRPYGLSQFDFQFLRAKAQLHPGPLANQR
jgi:hypothetical protein